ncbi:MAG TPA: hypothetical protein VFX16_08210 [Pseudonocardiaceae bacterium]|nr:hypothetical protein [Pseudonocardiaceae bacterium]
MFDRALGIDPDLITALSSRAALAYDQGEPDVAIEDLRHAVELRPDDPALRCNRAFPYQDIQRARQACLTHVDRATAAV